MLTVNSSGPDEKLEEEVDGDIRGFEGWFKSQGNDSLVRSEIAILKTFLFFKLRVEGKVGNDGTQAGG